MDQQAAERIVLRWSAASEEDKRAFAVYLIAQLQAELASIENILPAVGETVCMGFAGIRDLPAPWRAYECATAVVNFREECPEFSAEWDDLARRTRTVMQSLSALDTSGSWTPPIPDERTG